LGRLSHLCQVVTPKVNIQIITPAPLRFNNGNKITAVRWLRILRQLGHKVMLEQSYNGKTCDILIALHARRSYESIRRFHENYPKLPLIVVLTGTDLYRDIRTNRNAQRSLEWATRIVVLQSMGVAELPERLHAKTRVIYQSAAPVKGKPSASNSREFKVCLIGHLRKEKDPLRVAMAVRQLPTESRIAVVHIGRALDDHLSRRAAFETERNARYRWLGELPHDRTRKILAESHLTVIPSHIEGSSNVLSEALASSVPVIASRISGLIGTLGKDYPGYFRASDTRQLAALLAKAESDRRFYLALKEACGRLRSLVHPTREVRGWKSLLGEVRRA
jgi:putative glycosyltransferase (TIGR04348 family)